MGCRAHGLLRAAASCRMSGSSGSERGSRWPGAEKPGLHGTDGCCRVVLRRLGLVLLAVGFVVGLFAAHWLVGLDRIVQSRFDGRRFSVPSRVFAAPKVIYTGADWERLDLEGWLARTGYREQKAAGPLAPGHYRSLPGRLRVHLRGFEHPELPEPARRIEFRLEAGRVRDMRDDKGHPIDVVSLEPEQISAFYDEDREQRELV